MGKGFKEGKTVCCGSGPYRGIESCGRKQGVTEYELCDNVTEYVFFDSNHPTERLFQFQVMVEPYSKSHRDLLHKSERAI